MAAVTIRNLADHTHSELKLRAKERGTSTEAEIRRILDEAVSHHKGLGTVLYEFGQIVGGVELNLRRDPTPIEPADFG